MLKKALSICSTWPRTTIVSGTGSFFCCSAMMAWMSFLTEPRSRSWTLAKISNTGCALRWLTTVCSDWRFRSTTELSMVSTPGASPLEVMKTGVVFTSLRLSVRHSGVCTQSW